MTDTAVHTQTSRATVVLVEDHHLLAQSLALALEASGVHVQCCPDVTPTAILRLVETIAPAVVLLDLDLGREVGTSLPLIPTLRDLGTRVVMLTGVTDRVRLAECIEAGAAGIISKAEAFDRLVGDVHRLTDGSALLSAHEREELLSVLRRHRADDRQRLEPFARLTARETQVLAALMDGHSAEQIAAEAFVSLTTVRSQIRGLLTKLGVNSQLSAVATARRAGWSFDRPERRSRTSKASVSGAEFINSEDVQMADNEHYR